MHFPQQQDGNAAAVCSSERCHGMKVGNSQRKCLPRPKAIKMPKQAAAAIEMLSQLPACLPATVFPLSLLIHGRQHGGVQCRCSRCAAIHTGSPSRCLAPFPEEEETVLSLSGGVVYV